MPPRPTTPSHITPQILALCKKINIESKPIFVSVQSKPEYKEGNCWVNVENHINLNGGEIQHGWIIWESRGFWLEAEFHSIWRGPNGDLIDITSKGDGEKKILFLSDSIKTPEQGYNRNVYHLLQNIGPLKRWLERNESEQDLREQYYSKSSRSWAIPRSEIENLRRKYGW